jgi:hypothetical protein
MIHVQESDSDAHDVRRIQHFGIHINQDCTVICGVQIEAVSDEERDNISPELLMNVLYQIENNLTIVVDSIYPDVLYQYLDCIFRVFEAEAVRNQNACLIGDFLEPKLSAKQYMDKGKYGNNIPLIIGDLSTAEDLGDADTIMIGSKGVSWLELMLKIMKCWR